MIWLIYRSGFLVAQDGRLILARQNRLTGEIQARFRDGWFSQSEFPGGPLYMRWSTEGDL